MLSDTERAVLDIESQHWRYAATKEEAVRARLDLSAIRYYQVLNSLTESAEAWEYAPQALARVTQIRSRNRLRRTA